ncbi:MAG TPA: MFS transporter, partial [Anaerolineae bacterium]
MPVNELSPRYKWIVLTILTIGVLMVAIDTTVVILALPPIITELHTNLINAIWVIMSYIFVTTVLLLTLGRVADIYGRERLYNWGFAIFTLGSALCGFSVTAWQLIAARVVQGMGGALMLVNSWAILTETFPPNQRGIAMGINSMTFGLGGILGPVLGGFILTIATWRWVFFINIPIGIAGTFFAYRYLRVHARECHGEKLDILGASAFSIGLLALLLAMMLGIELRWYSPPILILFGVFVVMLAFFARWEARVDFPALDLGLFHSRVYTFSVLAATFQSLALFAVQFLIVFYLQAVRGDTPLRAALLLLPMPVALAIVGPLGGRLADKIGARPPATVGVLLQGAGVYWLSTITLNSTYLHIAIGLALAGIGGGLFFSPNTSA